MNVNANGPDPTARLADGFADIVLHGVLARPSV